MAEDPGSQISILVYRRLDNRNEGLGDDSPRALELHNRRRAALHDALDGQANWRVVDWGKTDDTKPHELIELFLEISKSAYFQAFALPVLTYIGGRLLDAAVDKGLVEPVKNLIARLRGKQEKEEILDFEIRLPDGSSIRCYPKDNDATITLQLRKGKVVEVNYSASQAEIDHQGGRSDN